MRSRREPWLIEARTHILNDCSAIYQVSSISGLGRHTCTSCDTWVMASKLAQNCLQGHLAYLVIDFWGFYSIILDVARIFRPHSDFWMCAIVNKQKFGYSFPGAYAEIWGDFPKRKHKILLINIRDIHTSIWIVLRTSGPGAQLFCNNAKW